MAYSVSQLYRLRFASELQTRNQIWKVLCQNFFQKYVKKQDTVCDLGAGFCEFINNIKAKVKIAVDINPETKKYASPNVEVLIVSSTSLSKKLSKKVDVVFASNFFEHLPTKEDLSITIKEIKDVLRNGGKVIILMPNIRYVGPAYWDFVDHQLPLTDKSMVEILTLNGFEILEKRSKFLPYSTKSNLPKSPLLVSFYLKLKPLHWIFGQQSLIVAKKK